jgi:hypothetical protein
MRGFCAPSALAATLSSVPNPQTSANTPLNAANFIDGAWDQGLFISTKMGGLLGFPMLTIGHGYPVQTFFKN